MVSSRNEHFDWAKELKEFHGTKLGVKGLVDAKVAKVPALFVRPSESTSENVQAQFQLPMIDFQGLEIGGKPRQRIIDEIREASETWGVFRLVNHGIPIDTMEAIIDGVRKFHEQPDEMKMDLYSTESRQRIKFYGHGPDHEFDAGCWKDIFTCSFPDGKLDPEAIPMICRKEVEEYMKGMKKLRETMAELFSEALGLSTDYLSRIECMKSDKIWCLYYPVCPEPEKTIGTKSHSDAAFLTLLLQDNIGGLQIQYQNQWIDVPHHPGSLIVNIGDFMQILSNDKFKSAVHRVLAQSIEPRISIACFFSPSKSAASTSFGPIKELLSNENSAIYTEFLCREYYEYYRTKGDDVLSVLPRYKIK